MGLMETIDAAANRDIGLIRSNTESRCVSIIQEAEHEAARIQSESRNTVEKEKHKAFITTESNARLLAMADEGRAIEKLLTEFRDEVFTALDRAWSDDFSDVLTGLCADGSLAISSSEITLSLVPDYRKRYETLRVTIESALASRGIQIVSIAFDLIARGGAVIKRPDGRRIRTETFEESFRRIEDSVRTEFIKRFCGE